MGKIDYSLVDDISEIGGRLLRSVDLNTGEVAAEVDPIFSQEKTGPGGVPLSTAHKSPFCEWTAGAGVLKVSGGGGQEQKGGGKRGKVKTFSFASRQRLLRTVARIRRDAELPCFVTVTYPSEFPSPMESKKHLDIFIKRLLRKFQNIGFIWKLEPQERGAPHYHLLVWGCDEKELTEFVPVAWYEIAGGGDRNHLLFHQGNLGNQPCVQKVYSREGVMRYASKYLGKTFDVAGWDEVYPGRFWAVVQKENIPFGTDMVMRITIKDAHRWNRYQRRFAGIKSRNYPSLTILCDADQWIKNILREVKVKK